MVKFNKILSLLSVTSLYLVAGKPMERDTFFGVYESGVCKELNKFLNKRNAELYACGMTENEKGVTYLEISTSKLQQDIIDKIAPYSSTLEEVSFDNVQTISKNLNLASLKIPELKFDNKDTKENFSIPKNVLKTAKNVNKLLIYGFEVSQRNLNDISTLSQLATLDFDSCTFENNLDYRNLKNLKNLNELYLDTTFIKGGDGRMKEFPESICQLKKLKVLSLYRNDLTSLPSCIKNLKNLERLNMIMNDLTVLPPEIGNLTHLHDLGLDENKLTALPAEIGQLVKLRELRLIGNKISTLPEEFGQLTHLKSLDLSYNKIGSIPTALGQLSELEQLDLSSNKVYRIPSSLSKLTHLKQLNLSDNKIKVIPDHVSKLKKLEFLVLANNLLTELPASLGQLKKLTYINVVGNNIDPKTVPESLKNLPDLEILFEY